MKVLMLGWEFPPHISGGLGTACHGIVKGLGRIPDTKVIFVVPKVFGDERVRNTKFAGADKFLERHAKILDREVKIEVQGDSASSPQPFDKVKDRLIYIEAASSLHPYIQAEQIERILINRNIDPAKVYFDEKGRMMTTVNGKSKEISIAISDIQDADNDGNQPVKFEFTGRYTSNLYTETDMYARVAAELSKHYDFDVIHAHDWLTYEAGVAIKEQTGKPLVVHVHATEFDRSGGNYVNDRVFKIEKHGMKEADAVVTVSNLTRDTVVKKYDIDPDKVQTVYNAVDFKPIRRVTNKKGPKLITFLGRITRQKGPEYFLRAAYKVLQELDDIRFVMAGNGDMYHAMIRETARLGIADKFHFTDFLDRDGVRKLFSITDVFVMPSVSEPFGIVPLEAVRSGIPVIISRQSGVSEILDNAIKVDYWDDNAMANAIYSLVKYPTLAKHLSRNGKEEVSKIKWDFTAIDIRNIYEELLDMRNDSQTGTIGENFDNRNILIKRQGI
ncbi:MAG: glycosyltransferase [Bacteroidales bacterium]|nr:glycosyltransferase [Bacteroidales bacterium]